MVTTPTIGKMVGDKDIIMVGDKDIIMVGDKDIKMVGDKDIIMVGDKDIIMVGDKDIKMVGDKDIKMVGDNTDHRQTTMVTTPTIGKIRFITSDFLPTDHRLVVPIRFGFAGLRIWRCNFLRLRF